MKTIKLTLAALCIALFLSGCLPSSEIDFVNNPEEARQALIGYWQGEGGEEGTEEYLASDDYWKLVRYEDGRYELELLTEYPEEKTYELLIDKGTWKIENGMYFENSDVDGLITYRMFSVTKNKFEYNFADEAAGEPVITDERTKESFTLKKPPSNYTEYKESEPEDEVIEETEQETPEMEKP